MPFYLMQLNWKINWWLENLSLCNGRSIKNPPIDLHIYSDASLIGWGAHCTTSDFIHHGQWNKDDDFLHINALELKAILFAVKHFAVLYPNSKHIAIHSDNSSAVAYINNFGGIRSCVLNGLAKQLWFCCVSKQIFITAFHVSGKDNFSADMLSRVGNNRTEWSLNIEVFKFILSEFPDVEIDLFASRFNTKLDNYVSWGPDPQAFATDAFSLCWSNFVAYAFPPFSLIHRVLDKVMTDKADMVLVAPDWPTQAWYPTLMNLTIVRLPLPKSQETVLSLNGMIHPLWYNLNLFVFRISGKIC